MLVNSTLARVLPFACFVGLMALEGLAKSFLPDWHRSMEVLWYPLRVLVAGGVLLAFWRGRGEYWPLWRAVGLRDLMLAFCVGIAVIAFWIVVGPYTRIGTPEGQNPIPSDPTMALVWLGFRLVGTSLLIPIIEELFWRSWIMRRIDVPEFEQLPPAAISWRAILVSSFAFALEHKEVVAGMVAGIAFAWLYRRRGNLRNAIIAHAVANFILFFYVVQFSAFHFWN